MRGAAGARRTGSGDRSCRPAERGRPGLRAQKADRPALRRGGSRIGEARVRAARSLRRAGAEWTRAADRERKTDEERRLTPRCPPPAVLRMRGYWTENAKTGGGSSPGRAGAGRRRVAVREMRGALRTRRAVEQPRRAGRRRRSGSVEPGSTATGAGARRIRVARQRRLPRGIGRVREGPTRLRARVASRESHRRISGISPYFLRS